MSNQLTKTNALTKTKGASQATQPALSLKKILILDTKDGAFTDSSVKIKEDREDPSRVVLKCVNRVCLLKALKGAGIKPMKIIKGRKHWIAFVCLHDFQKALTAPAP